jgi:tetrahydromethanopterin S-methyltransferase subunit C
MNQAKKIDIKQKKLNNKEILLNIFLKSAVQARRTVPYVKKIKMKIPVNIRAMHNICRHPNMAGICFLNVLKHERTV